MPEPEYKQCSKCGKAKPLTAFYVAARNRDGRESYCKECKREYGRAWAAANPEQSLANATRWAAENPDKVREKANAAHKRHPKKSKARRLLNDAIRYGHIDRPDSCGRCGAGGLIEGHHTDYDKPFDVDWLCRACHKDIHRAD